MHINSLLLIIKNTEKNEKTENLTLPSYIKKYLTISLINVDCVDNFSPDQFTFTKCNETNQLKCIEEKTFNFGRCFKHMSLDGNLATCSMNRSMLEQVGFWKTSFPSADYWRRVILEQTDSINDPGGFVWHIVFASLAVYLVVYLLVIKGIKVSGKAMYFTSVFPYFVLLILGIRGWLLPGANIGIMYYITPRWDKLFDVRVWCDAATAVLFSCGVSYGGMVTLASYNKFNTNIMRDAIFVPLANCLTSFFAGFVIFSYMGYLSKITGQEMDNVIEAGQGLAFVVYPYAVTTLVGAPIWSMLFMMMIGFLGISSQVSNMQVTITSILDGFPKLRATKAREYMTITCIFLFYIVAGSVFTLQSGTYWIECFNIYTGDWIVLLVAALECMIVSYLYGLKNFRKDIKAMLGPKFTKPSVFYVWSVSWGVLTPVICISIAIVAILKEKPINIGSYIFPNWTLIMGQTMQFIVLALLFGSGMFILIQTAYTKKKSIKSIFRPNFDDYIPKEESNRIAVRLQRGLQVDEAGSSLSGNSQQDFDVNNKIAESHRVLL